MPDHPTPAELRALVLFVVLGGERYAAKAVGCSENTIRNHLVHVRSKLGARTSAQAFYLALRDGYIGLADAEAAAA